MIGAKRASLALNKSSFIFGYYMFEKQPLKKIDNLKLHVQRLVYLLTLVYFGSAVDVTAGRASPQLLSPPAQRPFQCLSTDCIHKELIGAAACRAT